MIRPRDTGAVHPCARVQRVCKVASMTTTTNNPAEAFRQAAAEIAADLHASGGRTIEQAIDEAARFLVDRMRAERPELLRKVHAAFEAGR